MHKEGDVEKGVLIGKEGWLFLWGGEHGQFKYLMGERIEQGAVSNFVSNIGSRLELCNFIDTPYLHVVFPSKPAIMTEYLPDKIAAKVKGIYRRHFADRVDAAGLGDISVYLDHYFSSLKSKHQIYRPLDTHMTSVGAAFAANYIIEKLGWSHESMEYTKPVASKVGGDLADMLGLADRRDEDVLIVKSKHYRSWDNLSTLPGNTGNIVVTFNPDSASDKTLLVIGDSFSEQCLPYLGTFFRNITYIRSPFFQPDALALFAPDAVITSNAERYLRNVEADSEAASVFMSLYGDDIYSPSVDFSYALKAQLARWTYPRFYEKWASRSGRLLLEGVGEISFNNQIRIDDRKFDYSKSIRGVLLRSTGCDPNISFSVKTFSENKKLKLTVHLTSDVASIAQLFVGQAGSGAVFSEPFSSSKPVVVGENVLNFDISPEGFNGQLRFDPLAHPGRFRIKKMEVVA